MSQELYKKYRPKTLDEVIGQDQAVKILKGFIEKKKLPQAILLSGDDSSGCGKTTIARCLVRPMGCNTKLSEAEGNHSGDFFEQDGASNGGIDDIRAIKNRVGLSALYGKSKVFLVDECHKITEAGQQAMLKVLEDTPPNNYFILATTNAGKLLKTVKSRCTEIKISPLVPKNMRLVVERVLKGEKAKITDDVMDKLIEASEGSARKALVTLEQILQLESEDDQIDAIRKTESKRQAIEIARGLINGTSWRDMATILKEVTEEPESLRYMILGYARTILLKGNGSSKNECKARDLIRAFEFNFFDSKHAGLAVACWDFINKK